MNSLAKIRLIAHLLSWRLFWNRRNTHYRFTVADNPKFMGPREAVRLIQDNDTVVVSGIAGNQRISILVWAIRELFQENKHPQNLTLISAAGQGSRGKAPGTLEEMGLPGLVTRFIAGHHETCKVFLELGRQNKIELHCLPLGVIGLLVKAQSQGQDSFLTETGVGTFFDRRVGTGTVVAPPDNQQQFVEVEGDKLRYRLPKINVAMFNAPAADKQGNIYLDKCAVFCDAKEAALAAKRNGGKVIVNVGRIIEANPSKVFLPAEMVDAIVFYPKTEQVATVNHSHYWEHFIENSKADVNEGLERVRLINQITKITPRRGKPENAIAQLAASLVINHVRPGSYLNIGTGIPEEVCQMLHKQNLLSQYEVFTEAGAIGGVPAAGIFFGAAVTPKKIISSPEIFEIVNTNLEATVLGFLEVDSAGNVNVSQRGEGVKNFVGTGGFVDLTHAARNIFFVGSWMNGGKVVVKDGSVKIVERGRPKFIQQVQQISFSGKHALLKDKKVFYITNVGAFQLTPEGVKLIMVMPGISIQEDIVAFTPMKLIIPETVPVFSLRVI